MEEIGGSEITIVETRGHVLLPDFSRARDGPQRRMDHEERPGGVEEHPTREHFGPSSHEFNENKLN
jgi:hypothetical protein